ELVANIFHAIPSFSFGLSGTSATSSISVGGSNLGFATQAFSRNTQSKAADETYESTRASFLGTCDRRDEDWRLQADLAAKEIEQIDKQELVADIRINIAEKELHNHNLQVDHAKEIEEFLREKYTDQELYGHLQGELFALHNQCYQL